MSWKKSHERLTVDWAKVIEEDSARYLNLLLFDFGYVPFHEVQRDILKGLESSKVFDTIHIPLPLLVKLINQRQDFRDVFIQMMTNLVRRDELSEETMTRISDYLYEIVIGCDREVAQLVLDKIENNIEMSFYKDEIKNMLVSRLSS